MIHRYPRRAAIVSMAVTTFLASGLLLQAVDPNRSVTRRAPALDKDVAGGSGMKARSGSKDAKDCETVSYAPTDPATCANDVPSGEKIKWHLDLASDALDKAERHSAEWGHASISSAVLVKGDLAPFSIGAVPNYATTDTNIRKSQQGAVSRLAEKSLGVKLEGAFGTDSIKKTQDEIYDTNQQRELAAQQIALKKEQIKLKKAQQDLEKLNDKDDAAFTPDPAAEDVPAGNTMPVPARADVTGVLPELPTGSNNTNLTINGSVTAPPQSLPAGIPPAGADAPDLSTLALVADNLQLSESDIAKQAGSTIVTQKILNYITSPIEGGSNNIPWFVVTQVSVSPGSRTGRDYIAETSLHPYFAKLNCNQEVEAEFNPNRPHPTILAAFPLVEAQALDLRNSDRFETRFSLALAAKLITQGKQAEAKFFLEKMTKIQQDVATRTLLPVVVPSSNGREVTYRFDPGLQGLVEPGNPKKGSGLVLNASSVPALLVIMTDRDSLKDYSHLKFELGTRWIPKKQANIWATTWDGIIRNYNPRRGMQPSDVIGAAAGLDIARRHISIIDDWLGAYRMPEGSDFRIALSQARGRLSNLMSKIGNSDSHLSFPSLFNISPATLVTNRGEEQNVVIESYCNPNKDLKLGNLQSVSIAGYQFGKRMGSPEQKSLSDQIKSLTNRLSASESILMPYLSGDLSARLADSPDSPTRIDLLKLIPAERAIIAGKLEDARANAEEKLKRAAQVDQISETALQDAASKKATLEDAAKTAAAKRAMLLDRKINGAPVGDDDPLKLALAEESHLKVEIEKATGDFGLASRKQKEAKQELKAAGDNLNAATARVRSGLSEVDVVRRAVPELAKKQAELAEFGSIFGIGETATVRFPADRTRDLPAGKYSVIGNFSTSRGVENRDLGKIEIVAPDAVVIDGIDGNKLPAKFPAAGQKVTLTGKNFERVQRAYLDNSLQDVFIVGTGDKTLQLNIPKAPTKDDKFILLSDSRAIPDPYGQNSSRVVGFVKLSAEAKPVLAVTTASPLKVWADNPKITLAGTFPETTGLLVSRGAAAAAETKDFERDDKSLEYVIPPPVVAESITLVLTDKDAGKDTKKVQVMVKQDRVEILSLFPASLPKTVTKDTPLILALECDPALHGKMARVNVGGLMLSSKITDEDQIVVTGLDALKATDSPFDISVMVENKVYRTKDRLTAWAAGN